MSKKQSGFRARLNQHIDEGASKTDKQIEELKKKKEQEEKIKKKSEEKHHSSDDYLESDSEEGHNPAYINQLLALYK